MKPLFVFKRMATMLALVLLAGSASAALVSFDFEPLYTQWGGS